MHERARQVEEERTRAVVRAARDEGREPAAARRTEAERTLRRVLALCADVERPGAALTLRFWVEGGALTLTEYQHQPGEGRLERPSPPEELTRILRLMLVGYVGNRAGEVTLRLRRGQTRWTVDYDAGPSSSRPPEARTLPVNASSPPGDALLTLEEAARRGTRAVGVASGGAVRVAYAVMLEDGRLTAFELRGVWRTREGRGEDARSLASGVADHLVRVLLPFTEGLSRRTVLVVLRAEHAPGEADARGEVESAWVERAPSPLEQSWYLSMHEATLLRWREGVLEGAAWLSQRGVEEVALWCALGIVARGLGLFATQGLEWVTRALGREPEVVAGWLRTSLRRLTPEERKLFEGLWTKMELEGEKALSQGERKALRGLFARIERLIQEPLDSGTKDTLRQEARQYYAELHPHLAEDLRILQGKLPIHHRRPLQYAHLFPDENINSAENLAAVKHRIHSEINHVWSRFRKARPTPSADEVKQATSLIDKHFEPWYHQTHDPPGLTKTVEKTREAALRDLRNQFPELD